MFGLPNRSFWFGKLFLLNGFVSKFSEMVRS